MEVCCERIQGSFWTVELGRRRIVINMYGMFFVKQVYILPLYHVTASEKIILPKTINFFVVISMWKEFYSIIKIILILTFVFLCNIWTQWVTISRNTIYYLPKVLNNWLLGNPEVHYRPCISSPLVPIFSKIYPISSISTHLPQIHFNIILASTSRPPKGLLHSGFPSKLCIHFSIAPYVLHVLPISVVSI